MIYMVEGQVAGLEASAGDGNTSTIMVWTPVQVISAAVVMTLVVGGCAWCCSRKSGQRRAPPSLNELGLGIHIPRQEDTGLEIDDNGYLLPIVSCAELDRERKQRTKKVKEEVSIVRVGTMTYVTIEPVMATPLEQPQVACECFTEENRKRNRRRDRDKEEVSVHKVGSLTYVTIEPVKQKEGQRTQVEQSLAACECFVEEDRKLNRLYRVKEEVDIQKVGGLTHVSIDPVRQTQVEQTQPEQTQLQQTQLQQTRLEQAHVVKNCSAEEVGKPNRRLDREKEEVSILEVGPLTHLRIEPAKQTQLQQTQLEQTQLEQTQLVQTQPEQRQLQQAQPYPTQLEQPSIVCEYFAEENRKHNCRLKRDKDKVSILRVGAFTHVSIKPVNQTQPEQTQPQQTLPEKTQVEQLSIAGEWLTEGDIKFKRRLEGDKEEVSINKMGTLTHVSKKTVLQTQPEQTQLEQLPVAHKWFTEEDRKRKTRFDRDKEEVSILKVGILTLVSTEPGKQPQLQQTQAEQTQLQQTQLQQTQLQQTQLAKYN